MRPWRHFAAVMIALFVLGAGLHPGTGQARAVDDPTPRFIVYYNADVTPATHIIDAGYTHVILSFVTLDGESGDPGKLVVPARLDASLAAVEKLHDAGKRVVISFGGGDMSAEDWRLAVGREAETAAALSRFVTDHGLDGGDIDFEISPALEQGSSTQPFDGVKFLVALTRELRSALPAAATISHAPQPPYLAPDWFGGPYLAILKQAGDAIDWIGVQYYNNPGFQAPTEKMVVGDASDPAPTSVAGLVAGAGGFKWPIEKIVIGKPIYKEDAATGHIPPAEAVSQIVEPLVARYGARFGGLMGWQFSDLTADHRFWNTRIAPVLLKE